MNNSYQFWLLLITTTYHLIATFKENITQKPPGKLIDLGGYKLHLYSKGQGSPTVIIDHSLGGIEGYFLIESIAQLTQVCIYDRSGYGWSNISTKPRTSLEIVRELDLLLTKAQIEPPYILVGNSFGSYNVRLYAHHFPEKVRGIVLTDGLHERQMLKMPFTLKLLKLFFILGFIISIFGSLCGIIRLLGNLGIFELIKPELRKFSQVEINTVKRSFYRHNHWLTMARELIDLNKSGLQVKVADNLQDLPIISIKSQTFFQRSLFNFWLPLATADKLRDRMHRDLSTLSTNYTEISANRSSHFVWIDEPEIIVKAIQQLLNK
jgi:pimeloyl-ACP methyl ester carboxylesterase